MLTAMLELPGSKRTDLSVRLSTCVWNRVKQVTVSGKSKPGFPEGSLSVRERRFGQFSRTFAVGAETKVRTHIRLPSPLPASLLSFLSVPFAFFAFASLFLSDVRGIPTLLFCSPLVNSLKTSVPI